MSIRLNGSTSGYVEIDAPATAGSNTLVLPTGNGTSGQVLSTNGSGALSWATLPASGKILQTVFSSTQNITSTTNTTNWYQTNLSGSITPIAANSKLLVMTTFVIQNNAASGGMYLALRYDGGSTALIPTADQLFEYNGGSNSICGGALNYLDTAGSWSGAVSYRIYYKVYNTGTGIFQQGTMAIMEVAA